MPQQILSDQEKIIHLMRKSGYSASTEGVCMGISMMGIQAILCGDLVNFEKRLEGIKTYTDSTKSISSDGRGFFDGIELYQQGYLYSYLYTLIPTPQNYVLTSQIISPQTIQKQGGITQSICYSGVYDHNELSVFFEILQNKLSEEALNGNNFVFLLTSLTHAVSVAYNHECNTWILIDSKQLPVKHNLSNESLAKLVSDSFTYVGNKTHPIIFSTKIITTNYQNNKLKPLINSLRVTPEWQEIHRVSETKAILKDSKFRTWLHIAAREGQTDIIQDLIGNGANVDQKCSMGSVPLTLAVDHLHESATDLLLSAGANPNTGCLSPPNVGS